MKKNNYLYLSVIFLFQANFPTLGQVPELDWVKTFGSADYELLWASELDVQGNVINMGTFLDTVDFDPGPGQYFLHVPPTGGGTFIQKLDAQGNFLWAKAITGTVAGRDMAIGADGSIYITGKFGNGAVDFDPDTSKTHYINGSATSLSMFILKLNVQGEFVWVNAQVGAIYTTYLELDTLGNIYQAGVFDGEIDSDPDPLDTVLVYPQTAGVADFFVQKLDTAGNQVWFKAIKGAKAVQANALALNEQQEPVIVGAFKGPVDFDPGAGVYNLSSGGSNSYSSGFALHLNMSGQFQSAMALQGQDHSEIHEIRIDAENNFFIAGVYHGPSVDFDPGTGTTTSIGYKGYFLEKLDSAYVMQWVHPYSNTSLFIQSYFFDMALDQYGSVYLTGYFSDDMVINEGKPDEVELSRSGRNFFVIKHDSSGAYDWAHTSNGWGNRALSILTDGFGGLYLSGYFSNTTKFDPYDLNSSTTSNGAYDCFILKFKSCPPLPAQVTLGSMATLHWNDSSALPGNYTLSWYSCDGDSIIPGEHSSSFTPAQNGSYALIVERNGCQDTSDCIVINDVGLDEKNPLNTLSLFPNPTDNILHISGLKGQFIRITVMDVGGRKVREVRQQDYVDMSEVKPGTYFIIIEVDGFTEVRQVVRMR